MAETLALPALGSFWRERRKAYALRVIEVRGFTNDGRIAIQTVINEDGEAIDGARETLVRALLWHATFEPAPEVSRYQIGRSR